LTNATQMNASASEELAATSEELSGQAEQLLQSVSFFNLGDEGGSARRTKPEPEVVIDRRSPHSPMRGGNRPAASTRSNLATGTRNFRPY
jgi:methyl-accepting chemotaxis protein